MDIAASDNEDCGMDIVVVDDKIRDGFCCMDIVVLGIEDWIGRTWRLR